MNDFDELRDMMHRAAADPPDLADRAEVVRTRGHQVRRRRRLIGAAAALAVIGGGTAVVLPLLPSGGNASQRVTVVSTPSDTPSPTDTPTDTPTSDPATPSPVLSTPALPTPTPTPTAASTSPSPSDSPTPQQTEALSYSVATHLAPANGNGYAMTVVAIHVTGLLSGGVIGAPVLFIDPNETMGFVDGADAKCTTSTGMHSIDQTFTFTYAFREATSYPIHFWFMSGTCAGGAVDERHDFRTTIDISNGNGQTNGPAQPYFYMPFYSASVSGGQITIDPSLLDDDGNISQLSIDWGDGNPPTVIGIQGACHDPAPSGMYWPYTAMNQHATSPTLAPGTYTVTITETSTGCDGSDPQTASTSHTFTVTG